MVVKKLRVGRRDLLFASLLLIALGLLVVLVRWQADMVGARQAARSAALNGLDPNLYLAQPGKRAEDESARLLAMDEYWHARVTYPTGKFDFRWLLNAAKEDRSVREGVPAGRVIYDRVNNVSPLALDPNRWTSIGPQPQESNTCQAPCFTFGRVAGRTNDIVVDPVTPTIAYLASDGGGIWKSTNCCSAATVWTPVTDDPLISTVSIGDLKVDPNNHYVYAGTGDFRFGSFSFGSAGVLKSTDQGNTWQVKGADVFGPS
jgi:hypothetical protein